MTSRLSSLGVVRAGAGGCVEGKAIERGAERLVEAQSARLQRREAAQPLRPRWRHLAGDCRGRELLLGLDVVDVVLTLERPSPAQVLDRA